MATQVQLRRGTSTQNDSFTGAQGELTFDTTNKRVRIHDGATTGGFELKTENAGGDTLFADGEKAIFGTGGSSPQLQIYTDGSNSFIKDAGTGNLSLLASSSINFINADSSKFMARFTDSGSNQFYHNGLEKLATTATGINVTGTVTSDGLTVDGAATASSGSIDLISTDPTVRFYDSNGVADNRTFEWRGGGGSGFEGMYLRTINDAQDTFTSRLRIQPNGDISFYEDTGTTAKFFWDSSAESLGIGTDNPQAVLDVSGDIHARGASVFADEFKAYSGSLTTYGSNTSALHYFKGNVGIGTSSPSAVLDSRGGVNSTHAVFTGQLNRGLAISTTNTLSNDDGVVYNAQTASSGKHIFQTAGSEAVRIDSSGNLLVGTTDTTLYSNTSGSGINLNAIGRIDVTRANVCLNLNRNTSDGDIAEFRKDGTTVGSIGTQGGDAYFAGSSKGIKAVSGFIGATNTTGILQDNNTDLGSSSYRFKDLYLSGGVYLGGTVAANNLDDYEEGTFTPDLEGSTTGGSQSGSRYGWYTKIGRNVTVYVRFVGYQLTGSSGNIRLANLPFTVNGSIYGVGHFAYIEGATPTLTSGTNNTTVIMQALPNQTYAGLQPQHASTSYDKFVTGFTFGSIGMYAYATLTYEVQ